MSTHLLIVEPHAGVRIDLCETARRLVEADAVGDFSNARDRLFTNAYDWLVTNLRLHAYNGLHLVYLVATAGLPTRCLVYGDPRDVALAREAQRAGAFYERRDMMHLALSTYLRVTLPPVDRRDPLVADRRARFRGGRRCTDSPPHGPQTSVS